MSAEYSVEEVRNSARLLDGLSRKMLNDYAERIEADERAVPDGYTPLLSDGKRYWSDKPGEYGDWMPYFIGHPPAQAAQVDALKCTAFLDGLALDASDADTLAYIRDRFSVPAKPSECTNGCPAQQVCDYCQPRSGKDAEPTTEPTQPHSPDAADSVRVTIDFGSIGSAGPFSIINGKVTLPDVTLVDLVHRMQPTLAAQGQGDVLTFQESVAIEVGADEYDQDDIIRHVIAWVKAGKDAQYTTPPASPAGVPDGDAALLDALQHNSWDLRCFDHTDGEDIGWRVIEHYQAEPRERVIAEVFEDNPRYAIKQALLAAAPSATPEGGEVGS